MWADRFIFLAFTYLSECHASYSHWWACSGSPSCHLALPDNTHRSRWCQWPPECWQGRWARRWWRGKQTWNASSGILRKPLRTCHTAQAQTGETKDTSFHYSCQVYNKSIRLGYFKFSSRFIDFIHKRQTLLVISHRDRNTLPTAAFPCKYYNLKEATYNISGCLFKKCTGLWRLIPHGSCCISSTFTAK